jgi:signal transduction histidine kinase
MTERQGVGIFSTGYRTASLQELKSERMQGNVRVPAALIMSAYALIASLVITDPAIIEPWVVNLLSFYAVYILVSLGLLWLMARFPGHYPVRRIFAMLCDYAAAGFSIIAGCTVMLPAFVFIVWIALGNGLRYGRQYLIMASVLAQLCLLTIFVVTPHWQADPVMAATLSITALVVPAFAYSLLRAKEAAESATQAAVDAKSRFLAQASHDLRQPIHAMDLFLSSLKQTPLTSAQDILVTRLDRSLSGIATLFKSLLDISTIDGGAVKPELADIEIQKLFDEIEQQYAASLNYPVPKVRFVPTRLWVRSDRILLSTMIQNLLSNALKHAEGSQVLVGCRKKDGLVTIMVCDRGPGMEPEHIPHLFDEFYQVRKAGQADRSGVGLGLAIVQRLAEMLFLRAGIVSVKGKGTTASLHDLVPVDPSQIPAEAKNMSGSFRKPLGDMRVLLVEDDPDVLAVTADLLRSWGCIVEASLMAPAEPAPCDLIVTDYDIGGAMTGLDVIRLGRDASGRNVPAIIVTGHDDGPIAERVQDSCQILLRKPVKAAELRSAISSIRLADQ